MKYFLLLGLLLFAGTFRFATPQRLQSTGVLT